MDKEQMQRVSRENPCPVCGKPDWCLVAPDKTAAICARVEDGSVKRCGDAGWLHILAGMNAKLQESNGHYNRRITIDFGREKDFSNLSMQYQSQLAEIRLRQLSSQLNVSPESLHKLSIGWDGQAYTFPMSNGFGKIIGIRRRFPDGKKVSVPGSQTGLFIPMELADNGPLLICEGPTDTAAALDLGFAAIGRPNCNSKVLMTTNFAKERDVVIVGDNDKVGKTGAEELANTLVLHCPSVKLIYPPEGIKDMREWLNSNLTVKQLKTVIEECEVFEMKDEWELPVPLGHFDLPVFPLEAFPKQLGVLCKFCEAVSESYQVPVDLPAMLVLSIGGAALAKRIIVHVRGDHWEPVNLFTVVALPPANRKSGVFRVVMEPLAHFERQEAERLAPMIEENRNQRSMLEESLKHARKQVAKAKKPEDRERYKKQASEFLEELNELEILTSPQYIGDDATPESVALLLSDNSGRFALLSPEGDIFDLMAGRYSSNGASNLGVYLKGHAGDDIRVNRANWDFIARYIYKPALSIGVAVQPEVLRGLTLKKGFRGRGLLGRFLYSVPRSLLGRRKIDPDPIDHQTETAYHNLILGACRLEPTVDGDGQPSPHTITISGAALQEIDAFAADVEKRLGTGGDLALMGDWAGKLVGAVCRIAGIFHGLIHAASGNPAAIQIDVKTVLCAIAIGEYLIPHAKEAFFEMGTDPTIDSARRILDWVSSEKLPEFSKRDAFTSLRGTIRKVNELNDPLQVLSNHGYIQEISQEHSGPGRKPSPKYKVNPLCLAQNAQNTHKNLSEMNSVYFAQTAQETI